MKPSLFLLTSLLLTRTALAQLTPGELTCEHRTNPLGIAETKPRLSWKLSGKGRNLHQTAYQIQAATTPTFAGKSQVWNSQKVASDESVLRPYSGPALTSGQRVYWRVKVWDGSGKEGSWSSPAYWEMGLLQPADWQKAKWVELPVSANPKAAGPVAMLRKPFSINKKVASARAYATAHGLYELHLNGQRVGEDLLTPGWTVYPKRLQYQVYDITDQLKSGANVIGAMLGEGWYKGALGYEDNSAFYGNNTALLAQLVIQYTDGTTDVIGTDGSWQASTDGPIRKSELYNGEIYDARMERAGWDTPNFTGTNWSAVQVANYPTHTLVSTVSQPVRRQETIKPIRIFKTPSGTLVADFGQNMTGWVRLNVSGPAGTTIKIRHAEVLDKQGEFYTTNLRRAKQELHYTLKGNGTEVYEPRFTFMGFRYVAVDGFPGDLKPDNLAGVVIHTDMPQTGQFDCSNPLVNQLQHNIQWGQKGNFVDVPTDCPQRDERLGWTGDAQAFCRTAGFNRDVAALFTRWLADVAADQRADGAVPFVVPDILNPLGKDAATSAGWGDVATIAPWTIYQLYGDQRILETQYPSMKAYVEYIHKKAGDRYIWKGGSVFGDWLFYKPHMYSHAEPDGYTNNDMIATAFYAYSTDLLRQAATVLGKTDDARQYADLFNKIKATFQREYITPTGRIASDSQTAYVLALMFNLLPDELRPLAAQHLVDDIKSRKNHLSTGFLGTPYLCQVLSDNGFTDVGYDLLLQESFPSWLYPVKMGATTIWERWDGIRPDSTFQDAGMNSFNHYAYGAIGDWMYRVVSGIEIGKPGYKHVLIQPQPTDRLTYAKSSLKSSYGDIKSGWERKNGQMIVRVSVPTNTTATIRLPKADASRVTEGGKALAQGANFRNIKAGQNDLTLEVGSGDYEFSYPTN
ncbi:glycoside hydrolase family 78 protein [Spirosoma oryzicola]|uniref:glycoside hydrolase family 78 protein n=1 Tax=Spirosoma oryzicola TaxID=2898794 RepID=UPI001E373F65|nr:glycoside hydrolase family 78 protein [Spirosoma oryzicola]UHG93516.1 glycoside hydrolase family 78 protein [Spirosoma oryzicola]